MALPQKSVALILASFIMNLLVAAPPFLVDADEALIHKLCYTSGSRDFCVDCVHTNPRAAELNKYEIETQLIFCAVNQSQIVESQYADYRKYCGTDCGPKQIRQIKDSVNFLEKAAESATEALNHWQGGKGSYYDTRDSIADAARNADRAKFVADEFPVLRNNYLLLINWIYAAGDVLETIER